MEKIDDPKGIDPKIAIVVAEQTEALLIKGAESRLALDALRESSRIRSRLRLIKKWRLARATRKWDAKAQERENEVMRGIELYHNVKSSAYYKRVYNESIENAEILLEDDELAAKLRGNFALPAEEAYALKSSPHELSRVHEISTAVEIIAFTYANFGSSHWNEIRLTGGLGHDGDSSGAQREAVIDDAKRVLTLIGHGDCPSLDRLPDFGSMPLPVELRNLGLDMEFLFITGERFSSKKGKHRVDYRTTNQIVISVKNPREQNLGRKNK